MYDDLAKGDLVLLTDGRTVLVTDVAQPYEGMTETLFVYTTDIEAGPNTMENLAVADRTFQIAELYV